MHATYAHPFSTPFDLELAPYAEPLRRPSAADYARRRLVAGLLLVLVVAGLALALRQVVTAPGGDTAPASGGAVAVHVVRPGETVWSIARALQPEGDVRPLVDAVLEANGGSAELGVGQRLLLPTGS